MSERLPLSRGLSRRDVLLGAAAGAAVLLPWTALCADAAATEAAIEALLGGRHAEPAPGPLSLVTPAIAENGNTVPVSVTVNLPFTPESYVKAIHLFAELNPNPEVASFFLSPASGRAKIATRIRLARTQRVIALAELSDGRVLRTANEVKVTIGGCGG